MKTLMEKWDGALALRIPEALVTEANLQENGEVDVTVQNGALVVTPSTKRWTLEELVEGITEENRHPKVDWGPPVGREAW